MRTLVSSLGVDGEAAYKLIPNVELFCLADAIITCPPVPKNVQAARWAKLRVDFLHQRLLSEFAPSLQTSLYGDLAELEEELLRREPTTENLDIRTTFLLERAAIHTHHGFDKKARADLEQAASERRFQYALTGLLGKRTRYQEKDISQLVVLARSADAADGQTNGSSVDYETKGQATTDASPDCDAPAPARPQNLDLNDDTLLESISFSKRSETSTDIQSESTLPPSLSSVDPSNQPMLDPLDSAILLSLASSITNTSPAHGLTREETLPYATRVLEGGSSNWQVYTQALLVRSRIEGYRSRTIERGLLQLQALVDQVIAETTPENSSSKSENSATATTFLPKAKESESASVSERLRYVFALNSPTRWELESELASRWVSLGGLRSALEIYERLEMWAEAALCWAATEREDKAKKIIRRQLFHSAAGDDEAVDPEAEDWNGKPRDPPPADAPRLYCILGDIGHDPAMYEKAWEVSNNRYARAQRSLGRHYFAIKDYAKAAHAYGKSLTVNSLNHSSWFALGCALLELQQFPRAVEAFTRAVQLDDTDAEAWSNLAAALLNLEPPSPSTETTAPDSTLDDEDEDAPYTLAERSIDPQQHTRDALAALKRAAALSYDNYRIWFNFLTVAATLSPPSYADIVRAQKRIIDLRGNTDGEKGVDASILDNLVRHIIAESGGVYDENKRGIQRMVIELVEKDMVPLITSSRRLWQIVARLQLWRNKPAAALEAHEKAWRTVTNQPGWESGSEKAWEEVVDATVELVDVYESLGPRERTEGLAAGSGEVVARDWRFKARSAVRGIKSRGRDRWEGSKGWEKLEAALEGLKG
ncbi:hypothetical protein W97_02807 [Coniosporium apollinis CBS 100218]|uniref:Uncharacterized protein n=1 Tax=Coniosporium apollinis (strain CBS 100218) TaxID=1168221 RepID=R7YP50_CONA1|nr:uncharacterized protein W97_02807 [Coniosporium apollinis CBS 100218]EON63579.1 hypothetical protein W97_02807 [Coniosporium apollinis CBS 100218]